MAESTTGYPILLNLANRQVIVVGGGIVATCKAKRLLTAGARVLVISPDITPDLRHYIDAGQIEWIEATYQRDMMNTYMPMLVIAATNDARINQTVAQDARRIRAWVNVVDEDREESDFSNMAVLNRPPLMVALSTHGASPTVLRHLKAEIGAAIGDEYAVIADWLGEIRQPMKDKLDTQPARQCLYQQILESDILQLLRDGKHDEARAVFQKILAEGIPQ